jgi:hypothetical protein
VRWQLQRLLLLLLLLLEQLQPALGGAQVGQAALLLFLLRVAQATQLEEAAPSLGAVTKPARILRYRTQKQRCIYWKIRPILGGDDKSDVILGAKYEKGKR